MTKAEIKARIADIDDILDGDISDDDFDALEAEAATLTAQLGQLESAERLANVKELTNVSTWERDFLTGFSTGTSKITNRQAECICRINHCRPFKFDGRRHDCIGANYVVGFGTLVVTQL